jgi:hypothetical protein
MSSLNLRQSVLEDLWRKQDPRFSRILGWMESMEDWMLDDDQEIMDSILSFSVVLERTTSGKVLENADRLIEIMAYMSAPRAMRVVSWIEERFPDGVSRDLLNNAIDMQGDPTADLLVDRLDTLERLSLLTRLFSPARTREIVDILKSMQPPAQA